MKHLRFSTARQVIEAFPNLRGEFPGCNLELEPFAFIDSLIAQGSARQAMAFCAFVLSRRDAVQWLCQTLRQQVQQLPLRRRRPLFPRPRVWASGRQGETSTLQPAYLAPHD